MISDVQHNALGSESESVAIASYDPLLHAPAITALRPDVAHEMLMLMLRGMVSDPRRPVHGCRRRAGAATVRRQDIPLRMPHAMEFVSRNLVHSHLLHSRGVSERLLHLPIPLRDATESDGCCPVRSDLRRNREEPEQPHRLLPYVVESCNPFVWHLHPRRERGAPEQFPNVHAATPSPTGCSRHCFWFPYLLRVQGGPEQRRNGRF
jgi:hypothetical protein